MYGESKKIHDEEARLPLSVLSCVFQSIRGAIREIRGASISARTRAAEEASVTSGI